MLNIFNIKLNKNKDKNLYLDKGKDNIYLTKHNLPAVKEWNNSIYAYNKNTLKLIPTANKIIDKLIKNYFNLYNKILERRIRRVKVTKLRLRLRRTSSHRIYISKSEIKHSNNNIIITVYVYNRQKYNYDYKIRRKFLKILKSKNFINKIKLIKKQALDIIKKVKDEKNILIKNLKWKNNFNKYENLYCKKFIRKSLRREILYIYYKQLMYFNKSKFENTYLEGLTSLIKKIYNKNVELNMVNLKYFYLNSDILSESIAIKLRKRRKKLLKLLKLSLNKVKLINRNLNHLLIANNSNNLSILKYVEDKHYPILLSYKNKNIDPLDSLLYKIFSNNNFKSEQDLEKIVLNSIKYKTITGVRIEAAGRLSRRFIAARSVFKVKYKGSLKNIDSSYKGLSSVMLRGNQKSNIQYSKLSSKTRIGSYGIKGWVSSD